MPSSPGVPAFSVPSAAADVTQRLDGGVMKLVQSVGKGDDDDIPGHEDWVTVHYVGMLMGENQEGVKFDSTRDRKEPYRFQISKTKGIIPGLHQAVRSMRKNELAMLFIRSDYGYGKKGCPSLHVPPKTHLMYQIEMFDYIGEDISPETDGSVIKSIMKEGTGYLCLPIGSIVLVSIKGRHKRELFDSREVHFELGVGDECGVPEGVELACQRMIPSETARVTIQPSYAFGIDYKKFQIPKQDPVEYEVTLLSHQKPPEHWEVNPFEKLEQAKIAREKGIYYYNKQRFKQALNHFENILVFIEHNPDFSEVQTDEYKEFLKEKNQVLLAGRLNCSACYLKLGKSKYAIEQCTKILQQMDTSNLKALFRRGQAYMNKAQYALAIQDFNKLLEIDPNNTAAKKALEEVQQLSKKMEESNSKLLKTMFKATGISAQT